MVTLENAENALKTVYLGTVTDLLNTRVNPLLTKIEQTSADVWGKEVRTAVRVGINGGIGAGDEDGALPDAYGNSYMQFVSTLKNLYGQIEISDKAIRASADGRGAFTDLLNAELEGLLNASKFNLGRMLYGDGSGLLATFAAGADGKTAYQYAVEGGYKGTEAQFQALLNDIPNKQPKLRGSAGQVVGFGADGAARAVAGWSNPNLLDNWYFADPVNQRGQTSYENTTYTIDRWLATGNGQTVSLTDEGLKIAFKDNANEYCNISERFENYQQYAGKTFTASALIRNPDGNMVKLTVKPTPTGNGAGPWYSPDPPASDDWILITGTGVFSETPTGLSFMLYTFNPKQETTVFVKAIKLELGSQQTLAHQDAAGNWVLNDIPNKVEETKKCQRYQKVFSWGTRNFTAFYGFTTSATTANLFLPVGVPLRITPTILDTRGENWAITLNGNTIIPEAIQTWFASDTMIGIRVKAEYPTGAHHFVTLNSNSANNVIFDANL